MDAVLLDTCVLLKSYLCDTLLSIAEAGTFRPLWPDHVLAELRRNLVRAGAKQEAVEHRLEQMAASFPTPCHGTSGVLRSAATAGQEATAELAASAATAAHAPESAFGFQHRHAGARSDDPGILTGAAGIALAIADYGRLPASPDCTRWDALLLLS